MSKSQNELATEITIAWLQAKTNASITNASKSTAVAHAPALEDIKSFYATIYSTILNGK